MNSIFSYKKNSSIVTLVFMSIAFQVTAQENQYLDSLLKLLPNAREDSNKVLLLVDIGNELEISDFEKAKQYYVQAKHLSETINYQMGIIKYYTNYSAVLNMQSKFDSSLLLNLQSVEIAKATGQKERLASCLNNVGTSYHNLEDYERATDYYLRSTAILEELQRYDRLDILYSNIATIFLETRMYDKSYRYNEKAVAAALKLNNNMRLGTALSNFGGLLSSIKKFDSSKLLLQQAKEYMEENKTSYEYMNLLLNTSNVYLQTGDYKKLGEFSKEAKQLADKSGDSLAIVTALYGIANSKFFEKDFSGTKALCEQGLAISLRNDYKEKKQNFYEMLSELALADGNLGEYDRYNHLSIEAADEEMNTTLQKNIQLLDKKYETEKKNNEIEQLTKDKKIKSLWNYILVGSMLTLLLLSLLSLRSYLQKKKLQQQRITELEKEKQLLATEAVLKGQEEERSRLAKDLHDGLGGMLSGVKYSFSSMKDNLIMTPENMQGFERGLDMLDSSISELRRVAHSMMPEALMKFGLNAALRDFCTGINGSGIIKLVYQSYGIDDLKLEQATSVTIYRIIQELLNNVMKHAAATKAVVQVNKEDNKLLITVEDDGKGFDTLLLSQSKGIGWTNIQNRLDFLKAKLDVQSGEGKGTSVNIEITIV